MVKCSRDGQPGDDPRVRGALDLAVESLRQMPLVIDEFLSAVLALHDKGDVLQVSWKSLASLKKFASVVDRAWEQCARSPTKHYVGEIEPPEQSGQ